MGSGSSAEVRWSREQLLVALFLYCGLPFGKIDHRNPVIVQYASAIGRTPSALAMKLANFAGLDPAIRSTNRRGLENASARDRAIWAEMQSDWEEFVRDANEAFRSFDIASLDQSSREIEDPAAPSYEGKERIRETRVRQGQQFFRQTVLAAYDFKCCVTRLSVPALLVASHIVPWRSDAANRLNPRNGLCLSALHDRAFDAGLMTISEDFTVRIATLRTDDGRFFDTALAAYDGQPISLPDKFQPDREFLAYHRANVFQG